MVIFMIHPVICSTAVAVEGKPNDDYGPFGEVIRSTGLMAKNNPFRFSTKYDDDESDLLYYGYRIARKQNYSGAVNI